MFQRDRGNTDICVHMQHNTLLFVAPPPLLSARPAGIKYRLGTRRDPRSTESAPKPFVYKHFLLRFGPKSGNPGILCQNRGAEQLFWHAARQRI